MKVSFILAVLLVGRPSPLLWTPLEERMLGPRAGLPPGQGSLHSSLSDLYLFDLVVVKNFEVGKRFYHQGREYQVKEVANERVVCQSEKESERLILAPDNLSILPKITFLPPQGDLAPALSLIDLLSASLEPASSPQGKLEQKMRDLYHHLVQAGDATAQQLIALPHMGGSVHLETTLPALIKSHFPKGSTSEEVQFHPDTNIQEQRQYLFSLYQKWLVQVRIPQIHQEIERIHRMYSNKNFTGSRAYLSYYGMIHTKGDLIFQAEGELKRCRRLIEVIFQLEYGYEEYQRGKAGRDEKEFLLSLRTAFNEEPALALWGFENNEEKKEFLHDFSERLSQVDGYGWEPDDRSGRAMNLFRSRFSTGTAATLYIVSSTLMPAIPLIQSALHTQSHTQPTLETEKPGPIYPPGTMEFIEELERIARRYQNGRDPDGFLEELEALQGDLIPILEEAERLASQARQGQEVPLSGEASSSDHHQIPDMTEVALGQEREISFSHPELTKGLLQEVALEKPFDPASSKTETTIATPLLEDQEAENAGSISKAPIWGIYGLSPSEHQHLLALSDHLKKEIAHWKEATRKAIQSGEFRSAIQTAIQEKRLPKKIHIESIEQQWLEWLGDPEKGIAGDPKLEGEFLLKTMMRSLNPQARADALVVRRCLQLTSMPQFFTTVLSGSSDSFVHEKGLTQTAPNGRQQQILIDLLGISSISELIETMVHEFHHGSIQDKDLSGNFIEGLTTLFTRMALLEAPFQLDYFATGYIAEVSVAKILYELNPDLVLGWYSGKISGEEFLEGLKTCFPHASDEKLEKMRAFLKQPWGQWKSYQFLRLIQGEVNPSQLIGLQRSPDLLFQTKFTAEFLIYGLITPESAKEIFYETLLPRLDHHLEQYGKVGIFTLDNLILLMRMIFSHEELEKELARLVEKGLITQQVARRNAKPTSPQRQAESLLDDIITVSNLNKVSTGVFLYKELRKVLRGDWKEVLMDLMLVELEKRLFPRLGGGGRGGDGGGDVEEEMQDHVGKGMMSQAERLRRDSKESQLQVESLSQAREDGEEGLSPPNPQELLAKMKEGSLTQDELTTESGVHLKDPKGLMTQKKGRSALSNSGTDTDGETQQFGENPRIERGQPGFDELERRYFEEKASTPHRYIYQWYLYHRRAKLGKETPSKEEDRYRHLFAMAMESALISLPDTLSNASMDQRKELLKNIKDYFSCEYISYFSQGKPNFSVAFDLTNGGVSQESIKRLFSEIIERHLPEILKEENQPLETPAPAQEGSPKISFFSRKDKTKAKPPLDKTEEPRIGSQVCLDLLRLVPDDQAYSQKLVDLILEEFPSVLDNAEDVVRAVRIIENSQSPSYDEEEEYRKKKYAELVSETRPWFGNWQKVMKSVGRYQVVGNLELIEVLLEKLASFNPNERVGLCLSMLERMERDNSKKAHSLSEVLYQKVTQDREAMDQILRNPLYYLNRNDAWLEEFNRRIFSEIKRMVKKDNDWDQRLRPYNAYEGLGKRGIELTPLGEEYLRFIAPYLARRFPLYSDDFLIFTRIEDFVYVEKYLTGDSEKEKFYTQLFEKARQILESGKEDSKRTKDLAYNTLLFATAITKNPDHVRVCVEQWPSWFTAQGEENKKRYGTRDYESYYSLEDENSVSFSEDVPKQKTRDSQDINQFGRYNNVFLDFLILVNETRDPEAIQLVLRLLDDIYPEYRKTTTKGVLGYKKFLMPFVVYLAITSERIGSVNLKQELIRRVHQMKERGELVSDSVFRVLVGNDLSQGLNHELFDEVFEARWILLKQGSFDIAVRRQVASLVTLTRSPQLKLDVLKWCLKTRDGREDWRYLEKLLQQDLRLNPNQNGYLYRDLLTMLGKEHETMQEQGVSKVLDILLNETVKGLANHQQEYIPSLEDLEHLLFLLSAKFGSPFFASVGRLLAIASSDQGQIGEAGRVLLVDFLSKMRDLPVMDKGGIWFDTNFRGLVITAWQEGLSSLSVNPERFEPLFKKVVEIAKSLPDTGMNDSTSLLVLGQQTRDLQDRVTVLVFSLSAIDRMDEWDSETRTAFERLTTFDLQKDEEKNSLKQFLLEASNYSLLHPSNFQNENWKRVISGFMQRCSTQRQWVDGEILSGVGALVSVTKSLELGKEFFKLILQLPVELVSESDEAILRNIQSKIGLQGVVELLKEVDKTTIASSFDKILRIAYTQCSDQTDPSLFFSLLELTPQATTEECKIAALSDFFVLRIPSSLVQNQRIVMERHLTAILDSLLVHHPSEYAFERLVSKLVESLEVDPRFYQRGNNAPIENMKCLSNILIQNQLQEFKKEELRPELVPNPNGFQNLLSLIERMSARSDGIAKSEAILVLLKGVERGWLVGDEELDYKVKHTLQDLIFWVFTKTLTEKSKEYTPEQEIHEVVGGLLKEMESSIQGNIVMDVVLYQLSENLKKIERDGGTITDDLWIQFWKVALSKTQSLSLMVDFLGDALFASQRINVLVLEGLERFLELAKRQNVSGSLLLMKEGDFRSMPSRVPDNVRLLKQVFSRMLTEWEEGNETFILDDYTRLLKMVEWMLRMKQATPSVDLDIQLVERGIEVMTQRLAKGEIDLHNFMEQLSSEELQRVLVEADQLFDPPQLRQFHRRFVAFLMQVVHLRIQAVSLLEKQASYPMESIHISEMEELTSLLKNIAEKRDLGFSLEKSIFDQWVSIGDSYPQREITPQEADAIVETAKQAAYFTRSLFEFSYPQGSTLSVSEDHRLFIERDLAERLQIAQEIKKRSEAKNVSFASRLFYLTLAQEVLQQNSDTPLEQEILAQLEQMEKGEGDTTLSQYGKLTGDYLKEVPGIFRYVRQKRQLLQEIETILIEKKPSNPKTKWLNFLDHRNEFLPLDIQL